MVRVSVGAGPCKGKECSVAREVLHRDSATRIGWDSNNALEAARGADWRRRNSGKPEANADADVAESYAAGTTEIRQPGTWWAEPLTLLEHRDSATLNLRGADDRQVGGR